MRFRALAATTAVVALMGACSGAHSSSTTTTRGTTTTSIAPAVSTTTTTNLRHARLVIEPAGFTLPRPSARAVLVPQGQQLLLLGGLDGTRRTTNEVIRIDPATKTATQSGVLAIAVHDAAGAAVGGAATVFGGGNSSETAAVQRVAGDSTTAIVGQLPVPRSDVAAATIDNRTYLVGGFDGTQLRPAVLATTDGRSFATLGDLPVPVRYAAVAPLGTNVYVVGGTTTGNAAGAVRSVQAVDSLTGHVREVGTLPQSITDAVAATIGNTIYVIGGIVDGKPSAVVSRLDLGFAGAGPVTLRPVGVLPAPTADAAVSVLDGVAYVVGGESPAMLDSVVTLSLR